MTQPDEQKPIEPIRWPAPVLRVRLQWDGSAWRVTKQQRIPSMTLRAPDALPAGDASRGFWVEALDREGRVRHREVMTDPLLGMEQFDAEGRIHRLDHPPHDVVIEVLVPALPDLAEIHLVSNPAAAHAGHPSPARPHRTRLTVDADAPKDERHERPPRDPHDGGGHDHGQPRRRR